ncbi:MAG: DNA polymerase IV, partial [Lentisphaerae bacterium]|nr:DNA polymerase IV [Lentisphaerota bacterium]
MNSRPIRTILHADMDAFFASVEQRDHPELRGRPVVVGAPPDRRGVVAAASYEVRAFGVRSGMPSRTAARLCPQAVFRPVNMRAYLAVSRQISLIFQRYTPFCEFLSLDEAFLDVSGARQLFGDGPAIARSIRADVLRETGLTVSIGVASNKFLAKLASDLRKPDGLTIVPDNPREAAAFLAPLPVGSLFGVGRVTRERLERAGLRLIADVQAWPLEALERILGRAGAMEIKRLAMGEDARDVLEAGLPRSIGREHTFDVDCEAPSQLRGMLMTLAEDVGRQLRATGLRACGVRLKLRWADFSTITRQTMLPESFCDDRTLRQAALALLESAAWRSPVRLVGISVFELVEGGAQQLELNLAQGLNPERWE